MSLRSFAYGFSILLWGIFHTKEKFVKLSQKFVLHFSPRSVADPPFFRKFQLFAVKYPEFFLENVSDITRKSTVFFPIMQTLMHPISRLQVRQNRENRGEKSAVFHIVHRLIHNRGHFAAVCILVNISYFCILRPFSHFFFHWHFAHRKIFAQKISLDRKNFSAFTPGLHKKQKKVLIL